MSDQLTVAVRGGRHAWARRWIALLAAIFLAAATFVATGSTAEAATKYGTVRVVTQRMEGPHLTSYAQKGTYAKGKKLTLICYVRGQFVSGWGGSSDLWYKISDGYYAADVDLYTGSNNPITAACPKPSLSSRVDAFIKKWDGNRADYDRMYGAQCVDLFTYYDLEVVGNRTPQTGDAKTRYRQTPGYTLVAATSDAKKGDVAVWGTKYSSTGHIAIVYADTKAGSKSLPVFSQNHQPVPRGGSSGGPQSKAAKATLSKTGLLGYLRPKS